MDIFEDSDALLDGANRMGYRSSAPGQATSGDERPLRASASSPGPTTQSRQFPRDRFMVVDRLPYATVVTFVTPHLREAHAAQLGPELVALARLTGGRLALDMTQVTDFSCAWINAMIAASQHCEQFGGKLAIMSLSPRLENLLRETGLHRQLYLAGSVKEALQRYATNASRSSGSGIGRWLGLKRVDAA
ncbi:MAG: STAS domain-containing protein [Phycisphaeraceae bacterium]|nr:STAS domain-containing protein [Phycisphaeraceae bacterium]